MRTLIDQAVMVSLILSSGCAKPNLSAGSGEQHALGSARIQQRDLKDCEPGRKHYFEQGMSFAEGGKSASTLFSELNSLSELPTKKAGESASAENKVLLPVTEKYLQNLFLAMTSTAKKNGFSGFEGGLDPKNFCVTVFFDNSLNAFAQSSTGLMLFSTWLIENLKEDEIAHIMGHEAAHVLLNHQHIKSEAAYPDLVDSSDGQQFQELSKRIERLYKSLDANLKIMMESFELRFPDEATLQTFILNELAEEAEETSYYVLTIPQLAQAVVDIAMSSKYKACNLKCADLRTSAQGVANDWVQIHEVNTKIRELILKYYSEEEFQNKQEQDADEVGLEIMAFAGFSPSSALMVPMQIVALSHSPRPYSQGVKTAQPDPIEECVVMSMVEVENIRGQDSHPSPCWRLHNLKQEIEEHLQDFQKLKITSAPQVSSPSLQDARSEILKAREALMDMHPNQP